MWDLEVSLCQDHWLESETGLAWESAWEHNGSSGGSSCNHGRMYYGTPPPEMGWGFFLNVFMFFLVFGSVGT